MPLSRLGNIQSIVFNPGDILFKEGDLGEFFYLLQEGDVELFLKAKDSDSEIKIAMATAGDTIGEYAVIMNLPRSATARAITKVQSTRVSAAEFSALLTALPEWTVTFIKSLSFRIQKTNLRVSEEYNKAVESAVENARMGEELQIAKTVQDTLFPKSRHDFGKLQIFGHFESASECSGDWWYQCEKGDEVFLWIGDATGHGVSAALITSAARAVVSVLEQSTDPLSPASAFKVLNRAIYDISEGRITMTFFLGAYNKNTHQLRYANASHELPYLCRKSEGDSNSYSLQFLDGVNNPRIGENPNVEFRESKVILKESDVLLLYTDGIPNLLNPKGRAWGERQLLNALLAAAEKFNNASEIGEQLKVEMSLFQKEAKLADDITFITIRRD